MSWSVHVFARMDFLEIFAKTDPVLLSHAQMDSVQLWAQAMNVHVRITGQEKIATFLSKKIPATPIPVCKVFALTPLAKIVTLESQAIVYRCSHLSTTFSLNFKNL